VRRLKNCASEIQNPDPEWIELEEIVRHSLRRGSFRIATCRRFSDKLSRISSTRRRATMHGRAFQTQLMNLIL